MKESKPAYPFLKFILAFLVMPCVLSAQYKTADSPGEIHKKRQEVFNRIKDVKDPYEDSIWYHGRIYEFELKSRVGTPYFLNLESVSGNLTYEGKLHENLIMSYNLIMDELVLWVKESQGQMIQLVLNKYFVERFTLNHRNRVFHFRLNSETKPIHDQLEKGYYEIIYDDELRMFVRHKKKFHFDANKVDHYSYRDEKQVYLILDGKIYAIGSRRDYLKAFQDDKKSLRKYMRQANINFEKSGTESLFALSAFSKSLLDQ